MSLSGSKALVTGADGFIGSHLVEALVENEAAVTAMVQYNSFGSNGWIDNLPPDIRAKLTIEAGDIRDPFFVDGVVSGQDIVFHLAALIAIPFSYKAPQSYVEVNLNGTLNTLEACRKHSVKRMVHTSTSEVYGTARFTPITEAHPLQGQSPYSASKIGADHMAEAYWRSYETPVVILRPFNTFGPRQSERAVIPTVIRQFLEPESNTIRVGDISPVRDFNFVEDIVDAFIRLADADAVAYGTPYNAGSGQSVSIGEMIELVRKLTGSQKPVEMDPARRRPSNSEVYELIAEASRLEQATSWRAEVGFEAGLRRTIDWWAEQIANQKQRQSSDYLV